MTSRLSLLLLCSLTAGCSSLLPPPISHFELQTPRPFGYLIGDEIHHRVVLQTRKDLVLNPNSVPGKGELNRWLNLTDADIDQDQGRIVIDLTYQVFYAPNEVKMLSIPGFSLQFTQAGKPVEQAVPAWPFTLSPIKELAVRKDESGRQYMRPDALPASLSSQSQWLGFYAALGMALLAGAYLAYWYGLFPSWPKRRIFKLALSQIGRLSQNEAAQGLAVMHHAFNQINGQPLFEHKLAAFYQNHPEYRNAAESIAWFFDASNRILFGGQDISGADWSKLKALCRLCREIECGRR
ncbi:nonribosomal peptide synthetase MxaA [Methylomonas sp. MgM2]